MQASIMPSYNEFPVRRQPVRRGRRMRVRRMVTALVLAVALLFVAPRVVDMLAHTEAPAFVTDTVQPGDTLWAIAARNNPGVDIRDMIVAIRVANHMDSATVHSGQVLVIPKMGR